MKIDTTGEILWIKDQYFYDTDISALKETPDSAYVFTGFIRAGGFNNNDMQILKLNANGDFLWKRHYGGTSNDYGYDIINTQDGGFIICGRTESNTDGVDLYVVKTNCLGLLTEPQANYTHQIPNPEELLVHFTNTSQYTYPDSIDGGYYNWQFGDNSPNFIQETDNTTQIEHEYEQAGIYTTTLTAIVCQDTSIYQQNICVGITQFSLVVNSFIPIPITATSCTKTLVSLQTTTLKLTS